MTRKQLLILVYSSQAVEIKTVSSLALIPTAERKNHSIVKIPQRVRQGEPASQEDE